MNEETKLAVKTAHDNLKNAEEAVNRTKKEWYETTRKAVYDTIGIDASTHDDGFLKINTKALEQGLSRVSADYFTKVGVETTEPVLYARITQIDWSVLHQDVFVFLTFDKELCLSFEAHDKGVAKIKNYNRYVSVFFSKDLFCK